MKKIQSYIMLVIFLAALIPSAAVTPVKAQGEYTESIIQPDGNSGFDTYISELAPTTNYGSATTMTIGATSTDTMHGLINWDFSTLPPDAAVITATLSLWVAEDLAANASTLQVYTLKRAWDEHQANWTRYEWDGYNDVDWATEGAMGEDDIESAEPAGTVALASGYVEGTQVNIVLDPDMITQMIRENYYGFLLKTEAENEDAYSFYTSDAAEAEDRPMLTIEYDPSPVIADPGWQCISSPLVTCLFPEEIISPFLHGGVLDTDTYNQYYTIGAHINCDPYPSCKNDLPIYYYIKYHVSWTAWGPMSKWAHVIMQAGDTVIEAREQFCGIRWYLTSGECDGIMIGTIDRSQIPLDNGQYGHPDFSMKIYTTDTGGWPSDAGFSWTMQLSTNPFAPSCADSYVVPVIDTYTIDPTIEEPVGMIGETPPTDNQGYPTVIGTTYMVRVQNGPWNDGTNDRYDTGISFDGNFEAPYSNYTDYQTLEAFALSEDVLCYDVDPNNRDWLTVYFVATTETFYIRAHDIYDGDNLGDWSDNTNDAETPISYSIGVAFQEIVTDCGQQFTYDESIDWVASMVLFGDVTNDEVDADLQVEEWYAVEVVSGAWNDLPEMEELQTMDYAWMSGNPTNTWEQIGEEAASVNCVVATEGGYVAYIQARDPSLFLRVSDTDTPKNFEDNQGSLSLNIYHTAFERSPETCELSLTLDQIVRTDSVEATAEYGKTMGMVVGTAITNSSEQEEVFLSYGLVPGAWYALETYGGPWGYQGDMHGTEAMDYDMSVSISDVITDGDYSSLTWTPLSDWETDCNVEADALGHRLVYFQMPITAAQEYRLRVNDWAGWNTNDGVMSWNLYRAIDLGPTQNELCDYSYSVEDKLNTEPLTVRANFLDGAYIQTGAESGGDLLPDSYYAVELLTSDYAWYEQEGGDPQTEMELSLNNGTSWADLPNGALCAVTNGSNYIFYLHTGAAIPRFKLRVNSTTFEDNTEFMAYNIYSAEAGSSINPYDGCVTSGYTTTTFSEEWIPVRDELGIGVAANTGLSNIGTLVPGNRYIIETSRGPWYDGETTYDNSENLAPLTSAQVSSDNGATWQPLDGRNTDITCWEQSPDLKYLKIEFTVQTGQSWRIRVADTESSTFADNSGNLAYTLKGLVLPADTSVTGNFNLVGCNAPPIFPGLLDVSDLLNLGNYLAEWFDYVTGSIIKFFAWCPENTEAVTMWGQDIIAKEPFATLDEMDTIARDVRNEILGYNWDTADDYSILTKSPSESAEMMREYVFGPIPEDSPWKGGELIDFNDYDPVSNYYDNCSLALAEYVGPLLGNGICFSSNWAKQIGLIFWVQLGLDVAVIFWALRAVINNSKSLIYLLTGVNFGTTNT